MAQNSLFSNYYPGDLVESTLSGCSLSLGYLFFI